MRYDLDTILAIERGEGAEAVILALRALAHPLGYNRFIIASVAPASDDLIERIFCVDGVWPGNGADINVESFGKRCPITRHILETDSAFFWTKSTSAHGDRYRVITRPVGAGDHGLQVPVFGMRGLAGAVSFGGAKIDSSEQARLLLTIAGAAAFRMLTRLNDTLLPIDFGGLTPREREILSWVAAGRRQQAIAETLQLSVRTVENHLRLARQRLRVATTAEAVRIAIRRQLIEG